jgi:hypothetical protein
MRFAFEAGEPTTTASTSYGLTHNTGLPKLGGRLLSWSVDERIQIDVLEIRFVSGTILGFLKGCSEQGSTVFQLISVHLFGAISQIIQGRGVGQCFASSPQNRKPQNKSPICGVVRIVPQLRFSNLRRDEIFYTSGPRIFSAVRLDTILASCSIGTSKDLSSKARQSGRSRFVITMLGPTGVTS